MPDRNIFEGMYGADPNVFTMGLPLHRREKTMLFVGQLIPRKNIDRLLQAFRRFREDYPEWHLRIVGEGEKTIPPEEPQVSTEGFLQPEEVASRLRESRYLLLPSREDHWGLVVHEAALSGCGLIVSENVGAAPDLVTAENGFVHRANSVNDLEDKMRIGAGMSRDWLANASDTSRKLALNFGPDVWACTFEEIVHEYGLD
jgi:glycosyltransferase involved in cell wall biosynthesis